MDSLKVYLPSNASPSHFPKNTASDYRTKLNRPIELTGDWEVGVESLFYSSNVFRQEEKAKLDFSVYTETDVFTNDVELYRFQVTDKNTWKGLHSNFPNKIEKNASHLEQVLYYLNSININILHALTKRHYGNAFRFYLGENNVVKYESFVDNFAIKLTRSMMKVLGFKYPILGSSFEVATLERNSTLQLSRRDYQVYFFIPEYLKIKKRLIIKKDGEGVDDITQFLQKTFEAVRDDGIDVRVALGEDLHYIFQIHKEGIALQFSEDFRSTFSFPYPLFGGDSFWSRQSIDISKKYQNQLWYVNIYSTELNSKREKRVIPVSFDLFPRQQSSLKDVIEDINRISKSKIKETTKGNVHDEHHHFELAIIDGYTTMKMGKWLTARFSYNLSSLLGLEGVSFPSGVTTGIRALTSLHYHEEQLFILTDFIKDLSVGDRYIPILREFNHSSDDKRQVERRFFPVVYVPVTKSFIDQIHIQITDGTFKPITITDSKTILLLHFRRTL